MTCTPFVRRPMIGAAMVRRLAALCLPVAIVLAMLAPAVAKPIYGINGNANRLFVFDTGAIGATTDVGVFTGFVSGPGEFMISMDYRPADGQLYGVSSSGHLYQINPATAAVSLVSSNVNLFSGASNEHGVSWNPVTDRMRVVFETDVNRTVTATPGGVHTAHTNLAYAPGDPFAGNNPRAPALAYNNKYAGAAATTLFAIDTDTDQLLRVGDPNGAPISPDSGRLHTIGPLGVDFHTLVGFDIDNEGNAYASQGGFNTLYSINLQTGQATLLGTLTGTPSGFSVRDIAVISGAGPAAVIAPEPASILLVAAALSMLMFLLMRDSRKQKQRRGEAKMLAGA